MYQVTVSNLGICILLHGNRGHINPSCICSHVLRWICSSCNDLDGLAAMVVHKPLRLRWLEFVLLAESGRVDFHYSSALLCGGLRVFTHEYGHRPSLISSTKVTTLSGTRPAGLLSVNVPMPAHPQSGLYSRRGEATMHVSNSTRAQLLGVASGPCYRSVLKCGTQASVASG